MKTFSMKRVTMVVEDTIEPLVVKDVHDLGAADYTYTVVHGQGAKGTRPNQWDGPNARIEVITTSEIADHILEHIAKTYFEHSAVIIFVDDVEVLRSEKFTHINLRKN